MTKMVFITLADAEYGFRLSGVVHHVTDEKSAETIFDRVINEPNAGIVVIDERLMNAISEEKLNRVEKSWHGILLVLPSPRHPEAEMEDYAAKLIRRAIGYHVRLRL